MKYYFAYGSNINLKQMLIRCPEAEFVSTASLIGYRFIINSRGVASIVLDSNSCVYGVVWKLSKNDEKKLDDYEGVQFNTYQKFQQNIIITPTSTEINVFIYVATDQKKGKPRLGYLEKIIHSAKEYEFIAEYLQELESWMIQE